MVARPEAVVTRVIPHKPDLLRAAPEEIPPDMRMEMLNTLRQEVMRLEAENKHLRDENTAIHQKYQELVNSRVVDQASGKSGKKKKLKSHN